MRYRITVGDDETFFLIEDLIFGQTTIFWVSTNHRAISIGDIAPELRQQIEDCGGNIGPEVGYEMPDGYIN